VLEIKFNSTSYQSGTDFTYNQSTGEITWLAAGAKPYIGAEYDITYSKTENITKAATNTLTLPPSGIFPSSISIANGSTTYVQGTDYTYNAGTGEITWLAGPADGTALTVTLGNPKVDQSVFFLEPGTGDDIIAALGLNLNDADHYTAAQNAELLVEGVRVTRSSNTIDDLIGGVTLNLQGPEKSRWTWCRTWKRPSNPSRNSSRPTTTPWSGSTSAFPRSLRWTASPRTIPSGATISTKSSVFSTAIPCSGRPSPNSAAS
jgi:flagellar capping protein FliD